MAVDADLAAGLIDEKEAKQRREDISGAAEFHGAMDGAIRFTQRDAVASIIIVDDQCRRGFCHRRSATRNGFGDGDQNLHDFNGRRRCGGGSSVAFCFGCGGDCYVPVRRLRSSMGSDVSVQLLSNPRPLFISAGVLAFLGNFARNAAFCVFIACRRNWRSRLFFDDTGEKYCGK